MIAAPVHNDAAVVIDPRVGRAEANRLLVVLRRAGRADLELPAVLLFQSAQSHRFGVSSGHGLDHRAAERGQSVEAAE